MSRSNGLPGQGSGAGLVVLLLVAGVVGALAVGILLLAFFDPSGYSAWESRQMARGVPGWLFGR